ncbi:MAG: VOC family protein, partial [bacterium]|nr:VOC family protein [bacterium]
EAAFSTEGRRVAILDAGRATLEIADAGHADYIDDIEVGHRVAGKFRVAFEVSDSAAVTDELVAAGATLIAAPTRTPWNSLNARLDAPGGVQMTLFEGLAPETMA